MCTSITARRPAAFQDGGASVKPTQPGGREGGGAGGIEVGRVRIREVGQSTLGSRLEKSRQCRWGGEGGQFKTKKKKNVVGFKGIRLNGGRLAAKEIPLLFDLRNEVFSERCRRPNPRNVNNKTPRNASNLIINVNLLNLVWHSFKCLENTVSSVKSDSFTLRTAGKNFLLRRYCI